MRFALLVEYQGTAYAGFQSQSNVPQTIQAYLEKALSYVANEAVSIVCAGRTDAGVHASHQVIHFDSPSVRSERAWVLGSNSVLPHDIRVVWAKAVPDTFHARYSALSRTYHYVILQQSVAPAIARPNVTWELHPLNIEAMQAAAQYWVGEHDFSSFRAKDCQAKHPTRSVRSFEIDSHNAKTVITVTANAFLHHMIRNMVGTLLLIGRGKQPSEWAKTVLEARNRAAAGPTASPNGLYLSGVEYPESVILPTNNRPPWVLF